VKEVSFKLPVLHAEIVISMLEWAIQEPTVIEQSDKGLFHLVNLGQYSIDEMRKSIDTQLGKT